MEFKEEQFKAFMKIADNPFTTFRDKAEEVFGKSLTYQEVTDFKIAINKWYKPKKQ